MQLAPWASRPPEEANLFNPAFCGALTFEFVKEYQKAKDVASPFVLPFCALAISLHPKTRAALPSTTINSMYTWLERNSKSLIGYQARARSLVPTIREGIRFALDRRTLAVTDAGLALGEKRASFTPPFLSGATHDAQDCVIATRFLGRWFAKAGTPSTILSGWGIRP
jgi:hypothetical protein